MLPPQIIKLEGFFQYSGKYTREIENTIYNEIRGFI